jgi:uncharacterized protein (UPF0210 family)
MNIRSVTCFINADETLTTDALAAAANLASHARQAVAKEGFPVQTTRLAVQPLSQILKTTPANEFAHAFEIAYRRLGFDYAALLIDDEKFFPAVPDLVRGSESLFASVRIASRAEGIDLRAIQAAAQIIRELAQTTADGFGNFRFCAAANVPPGVPFFPAAYNDGSPRAFAFALECADIAVEALSAARDLDDARERLTASLEHVGHRLGLIGEGLEERFGLRFAGIDFSLAPYPEPARSVATAFEVLTGAKFGEGGSLFTAAFITDCIKRARFPRAGFSSLMLPVLEDWTLAQRSRENTFSLDSLLLYSTVCGTGLDTIPLAGETSAESIAALLLDLAALALKLDKPLTARLIPVPGIQAGEMTKFDFEYFANARAFGLSARADAGVPDKIFRNLDSKITFLGK